ncbi:hypothetical protein CLV92_10135 [Kineococcus xinjiangensis]|uniref:Uncharacterized protein n=2 Tax=Kineococcus xinjiangensis TaxID=512762 RepID=A0A2S6IVS8_9ACTN|nr:hypothetical protein CLV92_10135 [Kineococcus xinjiangensis]
MAITDQDGTTVTWRGPARGEGWTVEPDRTEELYWYPAPAGEQLNTWDRTLRDEIFGGGYHEELGVRLGPDGQLSYARSIGNFGSLIWAQGPELTWLDLDPCSQWPSSPLSEEPHTRAVCRVLTVDGHPVVAAEHRPDLTVHPDGTLHLPETTVFTVRPDGVAVRIEQRSGMGEPTRSSEDLARAALTLPPP